MCTHDDVIECIISSNCKESILNLECLKNFDNMISQCNFSMRSVDIFKSQ